MRAKKLKNVEEPTIRKIMTICFLVRENKGELEVCLGRKKRGFMAGTHNGSGGKVEPGESIDDCARRETLEEQRASIISTELLGKIEFCETDHIYECHVFLVKEWEGEPQETEELLPRWYKVPEIPYHEMGNADKIWLPFVLEGRKFAAKFYYHDDGSMYRQKIEFS